MPDNHTGTPSKRPLRVAVAGGAVVIDGPRGEHIVLTAEAAAAASRKLDQAVVDLDRQRPRAGRIVFGRFPPKRRSGIDFARLKAGWRCWRNGDVAPLRLITSIVMLPVVIGILILLDLPILVALVSPAAGLALFPYVMAVSVLAAFPVSWLVAPLLMVRERSRPRIAHGPRLSLVSGPIRN